MMWSCIFDHGEARPIHESPKLIVISVDGFRFDFLQRFSNQDIPNFRYFTEHGASVKYVKNVFPSVTYPNHMSIISGLYPENHGVVHNSFRDEYLNDTFELDSMFQNFDSRWFDNGHEVIYSANSKGNGVRETGSALWPGGLTTIQGVQPRTIGRAFSGNISLPYNTRVDYVINWLTDKVRPINLGLLYFDEPDEAGHIFGPDSPEVAQAIQKVDAGLGYLRQRLNETNLLDKVNIIITSDHGMIAADKGIVNIDKCIDSQWYSSVGTWNTVFFIYPQKGKLLKYCNHLIKTILQKKYCNYVYHKCKILFEYSIWKK